MASTTASTTKKGVRLRKKPREEEVAPAPQRTKAPNGVRDAGTTTSAAWNVLRLGWFLIGFVVAGYSGLWFYRYVRDLHELQLWFSNIPEVQREISLRTESGLYYAYYKQLIHAPSITQGIDALKYDNATEHGRTINILERFNIYQEVALALAYRKLNLQKMMEPILFYVYSCFALTGLSVTVLFALSWYLAGLWPAGLLTAVFLTVNLDDSTRASFTVNLRENFAFPFLWMQLLVACIFLKRLHRHFVTHLTILIAFFVTSFLFAIMWQFNQFVFLLQAAALYLLAVMRIAPRGKVQLLLALQSLALLAVWVAQYQQAMVLGALVLSFAPVGIISLWLFGGWRLNGGLLGGPFKLLLECCFTALCTILLNMFIKQQLHIEADTHIWTFVKAKFGFDRAATFESRLYLCHGAFAFLDKDFFYRTSATGVFPAYVIFVFGAIFVVVIALLSQWTENDDLQVDKCMHGSKFYFHRHPEIAFVVLHSIVCGVVGVMTLRMKYLWFPQTAVLAPMTVIALCDIVCSAIAKKWTTVTKIVLLLLSSTLLIYQYKATYDRQMSHEQEFYDPDTVALMEWISKNTAPDASFTGSMQLLAGVKCCTGRHLTNHPHFEDKWLRERTKRLYQIYGRKQPAEVHRILKAEDADYIILEDSICLSPSDGCRTPDLMDLENGHVPDSGKRWGLANLVTSKVPRFCDQIRHNGPDFSKYFRKVFINNTFRVYQVL
uniref:C-mannosyltransferase DPY19L3 n=1 Tax=Plectus sambesii TaxID=2011161 RepID=A0A914X9Z6_9BILA